jgi:hypothetical protein
MLYYQPNAPRAILGFAAIAISAMVLGALVILPAEMDAYAAQDTLSNLALTPVEAAARASDRSSVHTSTSVLRCTDVGSEPAAAG